MSTAGHLSMFAAMQLLRGSVYEAQENWPLAAQCYTAALRVEPLCYEVLHRCSRPALHLCSTLVTCLMIRAIDDHCSISGARSPCQEPYAVCVRAGVPGCALVRWVEVSQERALRSLLLHHGEFCLSGNLLLLPC